MGKALRSTATLIIFFILVGLGVFIVIGQNQIIGVFHNFFGDVGEVLSMPDNIIRNISFELSTADYPAITFVIEDPVDITIDSPNFTIHTQTNMQAYTPVNIMGFTGTVTINAVKTGDAENRKLKNISIAGNYESIDISDVVISSSGAITESHAVFNSVLLTDIKMKTLALSPETATLILDKNEMQLQEQNIEISAPLADFYYTDMLKINGKANRIAIRGENSIIINK